MDTDPVSFSHHRQFQQVTSVPTNATMVCH
uniref:Uncharacterized protein n=1 Tax=Phlebotomus papatasi TaxID=29031 RepID=A0A1B0DNQ7_PHLPP